MKKNLTVLVLLVTLSLMSIPTFTPAAFAGAIPDGQETTGGSTSPDLIVNVNGAADDDNGGDPGDAGDGYGFTDPDHDGCGTEEADGIELRGLDEYLLFLMSLIQLVL